MVWSFILLLSLSCGLTYLEEVVSPYFGFSSLLSIITLALVLHKRNPEQASDVKNAANQVWALAEVFLFVLVGSSIQVDYALRYFLPAFLLLLCSLSCRSIAVSTCIIRTPFDLKERSFVILSYLPKATVQAAIGGGLLDLGNSLLSQGASNAASVIAAGEIVDRPVGLGAGNPSLSIAIRYIDECALSEAVEKRGMKRTGFLL